MADYIPLPDADFRSWAKNYVRRAADLQLPGPIVTELQALEDDWSIRYADHLRKQDEAKAATVGKDTARAELTAKIRESAAQVQANPDVSDEQKRNAGLPVYKTGRSPAPVPATRPVVEVDTSQRLSHVVHFRDEGSTSKAKPKGVQAAEIWCKIGDAPPADESELHFMGLDTRTPYLAHFDFADAGKTAYYMVRWINTRQEHGPWSETVAATIGG